MLFSLKKIEKKIMIKELKTLLRNYFSAKYFKAANSKTKRNTHVKKKTRKETLASVIQQIGKLQGPRLAKMEYGKCPYCDMYASMVSYRKGYYTCINCRELVKQHINGSIQYVTVDNHNEKF